MFGSARADLVADVDHVRGAVAFVDHHVKVAAAGLRRAAAVSHARQVAVAQPAHVHVGIAQRKGPGRVRRRPRGVRVEAIEGHDVGNEHKEICGRIEDHVRPVEDAAIRHLRATRRLAKVFPAAAREVRRPPDADIVNLSEAAVVRG